MEMFDRALNCEDDDDDDETSISIFDIFSESFFFRLFFVTSAFVLLRSSVTLQHEANMASNSQNIKHK